MARHQKFIRFCAVFLAFLLFAGCTAHTSSQTKNAGYSPAAYREQTLTHLKQCFSAQSGIERICADTKIIAAWLPYMLYDTLFASQDTALCRSMVRDYLQKAKALGINTIFAHACAFGEAYFTSDLLPKAALPCAADPMQILSEECRSLGLSLHAWLNPLRLQTAAHMTEQWHGDTLAERWYQSDEKRQKSMILWGNRWYFNPADESVRDLICRTAAELLNHYPIDGIHIDDYFYPTIDTAFDASFFTKAKANNLAAWRREQISTLVSQLCGTVHNIAADAVFSISPQASITNNHNKLFADVGLWISEKGYCDWMIPQLYYGYANDSMPFADVLAGWRDLPRDASVSLIIGIATYKVGAVDVYAGGGANEWLDDSGIPAKETAQVLKNPNFAGVSLYHIGTTLTLSDAEAQALSDALR